MIHVTPYLEHCTDRTDIFKYSQNKASRQKQNDRFIPKIPLIQQKSCLMHVNSAVLLFKPMKTDINIDIFTENMELNDLRKKIFEKICFLMK